MTWFIYDANTNTLIDTIKVDTTESHINEIIEVKQAVLQKKYAFENILCVRGQHVINEITSFTMYIQK